MFEVRYVPSILVSPPQHPNVTPVFEVRYVPSILVSPPQHPNIAPMFEVRYVPSILVSPPQHPNITTMFEVRYVPSADDTGTGGGHVITTQRMQDASLRDLIYKVSQYTWSRTLIL